MTEELSVAGLAAVATPLPAISEENVFSPTQLATLISICEVFLPSLQDASASSEEAQHQIRGILCEKCSNDTTKKYLSESVHGDEFKKAVSRRFASNIPPSNVKALILVLNALNSGIWSLILTGSTIPLQDQQLANRTRIIASWANSYLPPLRVVFRSIENLTKATWLAQSRTLRNIIDFPSVPKNIERNPTYPYKFLEFDSQPADETIQLNADIIIVGSGCGAGVMAWELSSALSKMKQKPRIIVLEKGYHFSSAHFPMDQPSGASNLYEAGGGLLSDDGAIAFLAGSTFGGGGTVNWAASLQPQQFVREEWASKYDLPYFTGAEFQACLDEVCDKMGVCRMHDELGKHKIPHSYGNRTLLEGARRLGLHAEIVPQNAAGKPHDCGRCGMGCPSATKQGPVNGWFPEAAERGVEFVQGCFAQEIIWDETLQSSSKRAVGLKAEWTSTDRKTVRQLQINCPRIICSAGTLHSPLLLRRSGFSQSINRHVGAHLHVHPTVCTGVTFPERVDPWDGPILTSAVTSLENMDGQGHGPKIEIMLGTPDSFAVWHPWRPQLSLDAIRKSPSDSDAAFASAVDYKVRTAKMGHSFGIIAIQRDIETGTGNKSYVYGDKDEPSMVRVSYATSYRDKECMVAGALMAAKIAYTMGAETIDIFTPDVLPFTRIKTESRENNDAAFQAWCNEIRAKGARALDSAMIGSAHQMGTCRMSARRQDGVVDQTGKVWGTQNVWVSDASVFPSATGVNPMVTVMGISLKIARGIADEVLRDASM